MKNILNNISKEKYFLVVSNWVYFTYNYPQTFLEDLSEFHREKFSVLYEKNGSRSVVPAFWKSITEDSQFKMAVWIKNNYLNRKSEKETIDSISDSDYYHILVHWNNFSQNPPMNFIEDVFKEQFEHFESKWIRSYEIAGAIGSVNKFFTELSEGNQERLTDWVYDNYKGITFAGGGRVTTNDDIIEEFLTSNRQLKINNLSTHYNEYDDEMLLRNYGTLIATRKGDEVEITNTKYSVTTTKITNKVRSMALNLGMNVKQTDKFDNGGEVSDVSSVSELYDDEVASEYPYARDMVAYFIFGDREDNKIANAIKGKYSNETADESALSEIMLRYEYNWRYSMPEIEEETITELGDLMDYYADGGETYAVGGIVLDWMEEALEELIEETGFDELEITIVSDDGDEFYCTDGDAEYRVFKTEDDAQKVAIKQVREDLIEMPESFNKDWLMNHIDASDFFYQELKSMNTSYAEDIKNESDDKYPNRLIAEMVDYGIIDSEDAFSMSADEISNYYMDVFVKLKTEDELNDGNDGLNYFVSNFGEEDTYKMIIDNNLIDLDEASKDAVNVDGIAHFLSSYDGETVYLDDNNVAYRVN